MKSLFMRLNSILMLLTIRVLLVAESAGRRETLKDALRATLGEIPDVENFAEFQNPYMP